MESHFTCITMQKRSKFLFSSKRIQNNTVKYNLRLMKTFLDSFAISFLEAEAVCFGYLVPVSIQHAKKHTYSSWKGVWKRTIQYIAKLKFLSLDWRFFFCIGFSSFSEKRCSLFIERRSPIAREKKHFFFPSRVQIFSPD